MVKSNQKKEIVKINVPVKKNKLLKKVLDNINKDTEVKTLWKVANVNAIERLGMTDHGPVHMQIVANIALRFARILHKEKVKMSVEKDFNLSYEHAELIIFLASIFHDLGISISRSGHEEFSLFLANNLLREILDFLPEEERTIVASETLHSIIAHRSGGNPYTLEAGIVRVSDALDMVKGRSRIPYELGSVEIHTLSHAAIDDVEIKEGDSKPIQINITMNNSTGLFQVNELLKKKLNGSGIEKYVAIKAYIARKKEKKLMEEFVID